MYRSRVICDLLSLVVFVTTCTDNDFIITFWSNVIFRVHLPTGRQKDGEGRRFETTTPVQDGNGDTPREREAWRRGRPFPRFTVGNGHSDFVFTH